MEWTDQNVSAWVFWITIIFVSQNLFFFNFRRNTVNPEGNLETILTVSNPHTGWIFILFIKYSILILTGSFYGNILFFQILHSEKQKQFKDVIFF